MNKIKIYFAKFLLFLHNKGIIKLDYNRLTELKDIINKKKQKKDIILEFDDIAEEIPEDLEDILYQSTPLKKVIINFVEKLKSKKIFSENMLKYVGYSDIYEYFKKVFFVSMAVSFGVFIYYLLGYDIIGGVIFGAITFAIFLMLGVFYPKIKLMIFKGEIKMEVIFSLVYVISLLRSGVSILEIITRIAESPEFGILSFYFKEIVNKINLGYTLLDALKSAMNDADLPIIKKLFEQMVIGYDKGNLDLLLEKFYEEIVRESLAKLDTSKFMIQNLGNLAFGTGIMLPFSGMIISTMMSNQGLPGVINTMDLLLTKIGPMLALIFGILVKMKIE